MARDHARIHVAIWSDEDFRALPTNAQNMWFTLLSQPRLSYCGVLDYLPTRLARLSKDATAAKVNRAVGILEAADFAFTDAETGELLLRSFVRHDGLLTQPNVTKAMAKDYEAVLSDSLRLVIEAELTRAHQADPEAKGWAALATAYPELHSKVTPKGYGKGSTNG